MQVVCPTPLDAEWERLANIDLGIEQCDEVAESEPWAAGIVASGDGLCGVSEENMEVLNSQPVPPIENVVVKDENADVNSDYVEQPNSADVLIGFDEPAAVSLVSPALQDVSSVQCLINEVKSDKTLESVRTLADRNMNGYSWNENGALVMNTVDQIGNVCSRIVLPLSKHAKALKLAHNYTAHTGVRGMRRILGSHFVWPGIHGDIVKSVKSCDVCLRVNRSGNRKALMIERSILTVPFESVAVDLVGPLLKGKRGILCLRMYVCPAAGQRPF